jgi:selT/selW/selH-like putative selenoprotein
LKAELGLEAELIEGERGIFDVVADGELIFSKHETGRVPDEDEIVRLLQSR